MYVKYLTDMSNEGHVYSVSTPTHPGSAVRHFGTFTETRSPSDIT